MATEKQARHRCTTPPTVPVQTFVQSDSLLAMVAADDCTATMAENAVLASQALQLMNALPHHQCFVLTRRFGLKGHVPRTQLQVASDLGVSRSCVSRLENRGLKALRRLLETKI